MRYHIQENALFSAQNVTPAIQDTLRHMVQGDEAVLDWGFYTIGSPITITNATRLQYLSLIHILWPYAVEVPPVLGGYFTDRHFNNAWNRVVVAADATVTMRDSLEQAVAVSYTHLDVYKRQGV